MNTIETIKLDRVPKGKMPVLHASQYDNGRTHGIDLTNLGEEWKLDGTEKLTINERKVDNNICSMDIENTFVGSSHIEFASFLQMCACAGSNFCELRISKGDVDIGTLNFILEVEPDPTADGIESTSEIRNLETQIREITEEVIGDDYYTAEQTDEAIATAIEDKADTTYVDTELAKKADKTDTYTKSQVDTALNGKADKDTTYTKTQVDSEISRLDGRIDTKANASDVYTKSQTDNLLNGKADVTDLPDMSQYYDKNEVDDLLDDKANSDDVYDKAYIDTALSGKANVGTSYTKSEEDALLANKADKSDTYTKEQVDDIVYGILPDDTASGSVANFTTSLELPIKSLEVDVNAVQSAGTPTPTSPLPISGWNEIKISQVGKNLLSINDVVFEQFEERSLQNPIPSGNYVFSGVFSSTDTDSTLCSVVFVDKDDNTIVTKSLSRNTRTSVSIDLSKDCYKIRFYASTSWPSSSGDTGSFSDLQIELGSIATEYEPYDANSELISLGGTYYGGYVTQDKNGKRELVVTCAKEHIRLQGKAPYTSYGYDSWFVNLSSRSSPASNNSGKICSVCGTYLYDGISASVEHFYIGATSLALYLTENTFRNGEFDVVYPLATPFTVALPDGEPIITLNGTNNIYADTGDTEVVFKCSVNDYVSAHSGGNLLGMGGLYLGGAKSGGGEEEPTEESEEPKEEPKEELKEVTKTLGDEPISKK